MYHNDNPEVIQGSDIIDLLESKLERIGERVFAHLHVELNPGKDYVAESPHLHVTDGVNPRLLRASHEKPSARRKADPLPDKGELPQAAVEEDWMKAESLAQEKRAEKDRPPALAPKSMEEGLAAEHVRTGSVRVQSKPHEGKGK